MKNTIIGFLTLICILLAFQIHKNNKRYAIKEEYLKQNIGMVESISEQAIEMNGLLLSKCQRMSKYHSEMDEEVEDLQHLNRMYAYYKGEKASMELNRK